MTSSTITINREDTYTRTVNTKDSDGNLIDASGWIISFTVRAVEASTPTDDDTDAVISKEIAGEVSGVHTLNLTPTDTNIDPGSYIYDFQIKKSPTDISSSEKGNFVINGDVTRST